MAKEVRYVNIDDLREVPAWKQLVEEVRVTKETAVIRADEEDIAELRPANPKGRTRSPRGTPTSRNDPFWKLVGTANSGSPSTVSEHVDEYLAMAQTGELP